ncbi:MAG: TolC family protein [Deltaproteobacteria bacterium]|nr:TolC family protein [Deltaproteobacteria bacterium]
MPELAVATLVAVVGATPLLAQAPALEALTLEQAIALALQRNPALAIEAERVQAAEAEYAIARAALLPKLSGNAYYNRLDPDRMSPVSLPTTPGGAAPELYVEEAYAGLRLHQPILDASVWPALGAAQDGIDAQRSSVVAAQADVVHAVTVAWSRLVESQSLITVAENSVKRQRAFEALTRALTDAGKTSRLDLLKAEAQRMDAERGLRAAQEAEQLAQALVRRAIGEGTDRPVRAEGTLVRELEEPPAEAALIERALANNPNLRRLAAQARQAEGAVWAALGAHLPELSVQASFGHRHRDVGGDASEYSAGAFLEVPIFSGLATDAAVKRAQARQRELQAARRALEEQLRLEIRQALTAWRTAVESERFARQLVAVSREAVAAAGALYESGKATALEVLSAQADLTKAESAHVQALGDCVTARAAAARATGGAVSAEAKP